MTESRNSEELYPEWTCHNCGGKTNGKQGELPVLCPHCSQPCIWCSPKFYAKMKPIEHKIIYQAGATDN